MAILLGIGLLALAMWCHYGWRPKIDQRQSGELLRDAEALLKNAIFLAALLIGVLAICYGFICGGNACR